MELSADLLSQFAKVTNDQAQTKKETVVYGTIVKWNDGLYVQLDGSDICTPYDTTTAVEEGDRVSVQLKNHTATITGNMSSPAVKIGKVEDINGEVSVYIHGIEAEEAVIVNLDATYAHIKDLDATNAEIVNLKADKADITDLEAINADIDNLSAETAKIKDLEADFGDFKVLTVEELAAKYAFIAELDANEIDTDSLDAKYANIDFANVGVANIDQLFAKYGMIEVIEGVDGNFTRNLVGVNIIGDTIQANNLVVKGENGIFYKLNIDTTGGVLPEEVSEEDIKNGLLGTVIVAKSITADKISVTDLSAFGATIGGFKITSNAIHSVAKDNPNNTTRGIYLDNEGQIAVGDTNHFLKYYKQADGTYKFEIVADSIKLKTGDKNVDVSEFGTRLDTAETEINQNKEAIKLKASETYVADAIKDIDVGARNLLLNTGDPTTVDASSGSANKYQKIPMSVSKLTEGQVYTFSVNVNITAGSPTDITIALYDAGVKNSSGRSHLTIVDGRVSGQITAGSTAESFLIYAGHAGSTAGNVITFSNMKLEKGNKATDWSPAPEDYYTKSQTDAQFTVTSEAITSTVAKIYSTKQELQDLEIGACNLVPNSDFSAGTNDWTIVGVTASAEFDETHGTCLKFTSPAAGSPDYRIYTNTLRHTGGTYSLSFYAKSDAATTLQSNVAGGAEVYKNYDLTTSWKRYTHTYDASSGSLTFWLPNANTTAYITKIQVERGDKVTDWSLAPSDISSTKDLEDSNADLNNRIDGLDTRINEATSAIQQLADSISMFVTDGDGASLMTQTENGWTFNIGNIQTAVNNVSDALNTLQENSNSLDSSVKSLEQAINDIGKVTERVTIGTYSYVDENGVTKTEPSVEWSEADTDFKLIITNTQALFRDGSNLPTKINTHGLITENITVNNEFRQQGFVWAVRTNGNYGLMWKGVS